MIRADDHNDVTVAGGTFRIEDDWTEPDAVSAAVLDAVAACAHLDVLDLEPLGDVVDIDALNDLFSRRTNGRPRTGVSVRFEYHGYDVNVESDGVIYLRLA